ARRNCALYLLSSAAYVICSAPDVPRLEAPWGISLLLASLGTPALFWMSAAAVFDDDFKPSWRRGLVWLGLVAIGLWSVLDSHLLGDIAYYGLSLVLVGLGVWHTLIRGKSDLVEAYRRSRVLTAILAALHIAAIVITSLLWPGSSIVAPFSTINAVGL